MTNKEIANKFQDLANIMELHQENKFKIRSYKNAYITLRKLDQPLSEMSDTDIQGIKGVGKAISEKIRNLLNGEEINAFQKYADITPKGVMEMLQIKGFGPSKIRVIWKELECETVGELLYACNENRLITLKGFGAKTQQDLIEKINFYFRSRDKFLFAKAEKTAENILLELQRIFPENQVAFVGEYRCKNPILHSIDFLIDNKNIEGSLPESLTLLDKNDSVFVLKTENDFPVKIYTCESQEWGSKLFRYSTTKDFIQDFMSASVAKDFKNIPTEKELFEKAEIPFILPELRYDKSFINKDVSNIIEEKDINGVIHAHSTYSDGINSLEEMAEAARKMGFQYLGITDHSKSAFYANGLKEDRVQKQWDEIDSLNQKWDDFKIYKGIESDILNDGSLDYDEEILKGFDFIIASVHSNLKMTEEKANARIIKAIENPYTTILGHPTGRLLLSRAGYPIDYKKIIDACAANNVAIEMNANPLRLDMDYTWIPYMMEKGVKMCINPDAHSIKGISDIKYGVYAARKGGLTRDMLFGL